MHKRLVRVVILLFIALAAALGVASAAGAIGHNSDPVTTSNDANSWGAGSFSVAINLN